MAYRNLSVNQSIYQSACWTCSWLRPPTSVYMQKRRTWMKNKEQSQWSLSGCDGSHVFRCLSSSCDASVAVGLTAPRRFMCRSVRIRSTNNGRLIVGRKPAELISCHETFSQETETAPWPRPKCSKKRLETDSVSRLRHSRPRRHLCNSGIKYDASVCLYIRFLLPNRLIAQVTFGGKYI